MQTQSILYRTLWLFAATFLAVAVAFAITIWWILRRGKTPPRAGSASGRSVTMSPGSDRFGAKPAVLRCARCGKFVDWDDAQVQVVCACKPRIDLPPVLVREATEADRRAARVLFERDFGRTKIVAFGEIIDIEQMPALVAVRHHEPSGASGIPACG